MLLLLLIASKVHSQQFFTRESNLFRDGDILIYEKIHADSIWDLYHSQPTNEKYLDTYVCNGTDSIVRIFRRSRSQYQNKDDSLLLVGYEDNLRAFHYCQPRLELHYPFLMHLQQDGSFKADVMYCNRINMNLDGTCNSRTRYIPYLLLPSGDTLKNTILISSELKYQLHDSTMDTICYHRHDSTSIICLERVQRVFALGFRYPIVTKYEVADYDSPQRIISSTTYYCDPDFQRYNITDDPNTIIRTNVENSNLDICKDRWKKQDNDISRFVKNESGSGKVSISFMADEPVTGMLILSDAPGRVYRTESFSGGTGEQVNASVNYAGLRKGAYVLHVKLNTNIYQCTVYVE